MTVEATTSKYNLKTLRLYAVACLIGAVVLAYDGYLSKYEWSKRADFYKEHVTDNDGVPDSTMKFNRFLPPILVLGTLIFGVKYMSIKDKKVVATESDLIMPCGTKYSYDSIEKIDKTHFDSKGYFVVTCKQDDGERELKLNDKSYDNLPAVLDKLVAAIS